jgi:hypothetical protein
MSNTRNRNRLALIFIFVLFFIPLLAAVVLNSKWVQYEPGETVNRGALVEPPVPMDETLLLERNFPAAEELAGRWLLVHPLPGGCDALCGEVVTELRQIHIGTGRHQEEVAILLLSDQPMSDELRLELEEIYPRFVIADEVNTAVMETLIAANNGNPPAAGVSFIADPEGNIMLRYDPGYAPGDLNKDLRKLLKWSGR